MRIFNKRRVNKKIRINLSVFVLAFVFLLGIAYSAFGTELKISKFLADVRLKKDIRITGFNVKDVSSSPCEYSKDEDGYKMVTCGTQSFYIIDETSTTLTVLSQYNLKNLATEPIQDTTGESNDTTFSESNYWYDSTNSIFIVDTNYEDEGRTYPYIYNSSSVRYEQIELYKQMIEGLGVNIIDSKLLSYEQAIELGCSESSCTSAPSWLYSTNYWTGSAYEGNSVWTISSSGTFNSNEYDSNAGIRPVLTIAKSSVVSNTNGGESRYQDYNISSISSEINLPNENSTITYTVTVTNIEAIEMGILEITGLPDNLEIADTTFLKQKICDENDKCNLGISKDIDITLQYKEGSYDSNNTTFNVNLDFNFKPTYTVTYTDIANNNYPTTALETDTLEIDFKENAPSGLKILVEGVEITEYTYEDGILTIPNISGNIEIIKEEQETFADASWETIIKNAQSGNTSMYNVGDKKTITLTGTGDLGQTLTVRVANNSTPSECSTEGFSQTACGFVIEFEDIITTHVMNSTLTNVGGWRDSELRAYINNDILNALPTELRNDIIDTEVISGHGKNEGETNFETTDKLYLLTTHEVWEDIDGDTNTGIDYYDTAYYNTRQLDYYKSIGVTTSNYSGAIKNYNGSASYWWFRSAFSNATITFYGVHDDGMWYYYHYANTARGVSVAFRLG